jgi:hypothetical protein
MTKTINLRPSDSSALCPAARAWLVMINGSEGAAYPTREAAECAAAGYRRAYRLAIVTIEHWSEWAAWRGETV